MSSSDPLLRWRKEFPVLATSTYLISNSLGAMPRAVRGDLREYTDLWANRGVRAWGDAWWDMQEEIGNRIAPLIGAGKGELSMHPNISLLQAILISCFSFASKRKDIVLTDMEFPSVGYVYQQFAASRGARLRIARSDDGIRVPTERVLKLINDRTLLVSISHVLFKSAYIQDVRAIAEKAHRHGAIVILDAYHSVGIIPVDVHALGVDVLVGGVLKWLCGGPGGAFLWVRKSLSRKLRPGITGWMAHQEPFAFSPEMSYRNDAHRFLNGTPSIPSLYAARAGPGIIARAGVKDIRKKSLHQTTMLMDRAEEMGFTPLSPRNPSERGGTITLKVPHAYQVSRELLRRDIIIDFREGAGIRMAPHFYNSDAEILFALDEVESILRTRAYKKHSLRRAHVT